MSKFLYHKIQYRLLNQKPYSDYKKSHQKKILFLGIQPNYEPKLTNFLWPYVEPSTAQIWERP